MAWQVTISGHDGEGNPEHENLQKVVDAAVAEAESQGLLPTVTVINGTIQGVAIGPVETQLDTPPVNTSPEDTSPSLRPAQNDTKAEWVAYAVANGMDDTEAEGMTKTDLIDKYGYDD
jgi:hypothetical protein